MRRTSTAKGEAERMSGIVPDRAIQGKSELAPWGNELRDTIRWMVKSPEPFAERLKRLRMAKHLTQEELARRSGLNRFTIAKLEAGTRGDPGLTTVLKLAAGLGVPVSAFGGPVRQESEEHLRAFLESSLARALSEEGAPITPDEEEMLRRVIEGVWVEGSPTPRVLYAILLAFRSSVPPAR
jgi:transcriptional regulator with XRE-family HTH domain